MSNDSLKAWIDAMPIDDVRAKIARLERKISDLQVLERIYADRHGGGEAAATEGGGDAVPSEGESTPGWGEGAPGSEHS